MDCLGPSKEHKRMFFLSAIIVFLSFQIHALEVVTWNIQKGSNSNWTDYIKANAQVDYWGVQEATKSIYQDSFRLYFKTLYNSAWESPSLNTGTLSASFQEHIDVFKVITDVTEPILNTPKSFIVSTIKNKCAQSVKVVNIHMINFRLGQAYSDQLFQISKYINNHHGPLIVLGDFNNWNYLRTRTLKKWLKSHDLKTHMNNQIIDESNIDHIFFRGLKLIDYQKDIVNLSDHEPIRATFDCKNSINEVSEYN